jgi:hypothetical protein
MNAPRWFTDSPRDQLGIGGLAEYASEADANAAAGTAGRVLALVTPEYVRVVEAAQAQRSAMGHPELSDQQIEKLFTDVADAVDAVIRLPEQDPAA